MNSTDVERTVIHYRHSDRIAALLAAFGLGTITGLIDKLHRNGMFYRSQLTVTLLGLLSLMCATGCYAPLRSPATPANCLSDVYRMPVRSVPSKLNMANLAVPTPVDYILGPNDVLEVVVVGLADPGRGEQVRPIQVRIMANGMVRLPLVGEVKVSEMNLSQAQKTIDDAYADGIIVRPKTSVSLLQMAQINVPVIGEVTKPGVHPLPRHENDAAHALALAGGLTLFAAEVVEVHRRMSEDDLVSRLSTTFTEGDDPQTIVIPEVLDAPNSPARPLGNSKTVVLRIPLRCGVPAIIVDNQVIPQENLTIEDVTLNPGDVIVVPRQPDEVFFVVGPLSRNNTVNFRVSELDRRLGNAFLLPKDRDVDVVTAVAMAGYIDPIDSPTTVTVHRSMPGAPPKLIRVDLIAARYNWKENIYVQPGDIIYLNPDAAWWSRRMFDRIAPELLLAPYKEAMFRWINPRALTN